MNVGESMQLGRYVVRAMMRPDNPAFPKYVVFCGDRLVGVQFSLPCLSDCEWLERSVYAETTNGSGYGHTYSLRPRRRGRPRKQEAERELAEALVP